MINSGMERPFMDFWVKKFLLYFGNVFVLPHLLFTFTNNYKFSYIDRYEKSRNTHLQRCNES
ncbi:hypothetical protein SAMN03080601_01719 [Alkalitalea saponilacus]|uniref:Uncharacterized protein n=1 Tax=Alkalitalea saponilacus TaxID=889453 RepID=A0A1T5G3S0_9BACT|nr:hypothetical protein SAMN03080601_01719 [Alkalitalea saponilacus]